MAVLVDSSVWINASSPKKKECLKLKRLIESGELIYLSHPIQVEICQGARSEKEFHMLWENLLGFSFLEIEAIHWGKSSWNYFLCRKKGFTVSTIDCLIATLSKEYGVPLWSTDKIFKKIQPVIGYEVWKG